MLACLGVIEGDGAFDRIFHVELALQHVVPGGAVGVLEVSHPAARPRVQRVDRHLSVGWPRQLHTPVLKVVWDRRDLPVALPALPRLRQEIRHLAGADSLLPLGPHGKELFHSPPVLPRELRHESDSRGREYPGELVRDIGSKLDPLGVGARLIRHDLRLLSTAFQSEATLSSHAPVRSEPKTRSGCRPGLLTDLPDDPVHIDDARGRHATPPVEDPVLVETYHHPRPDGRRTLLVAPLQNLLRLRVPVLYRNHSSLLSTSPS